jgi:hypothetical protein
MRSCLSIWPTPRSTPPGTHNGPQFRNTADGDGIEFEDWSLATHVPGVVALIQRLASDAIGGAADHAEAIDRIEQSCRALVDSAHTTTLDELSDALGSLRDLVEGG